MPVFLFDYYHEGDWWSLEIAADSREDAEARLRKLPHARYVGELAARVPAHRWLLWPLRMLLNMVCWVRNRRARRSGVSQR